jgi:DNA repair ATPase RecN
MITNFKLFEESRFFSMEDIDKILDKIIDEGGYEKLSNIDKKILKNYSLDDAEIEETIENIISLKNEANTLLKTTDLDSIKLEEGERKLMELHNIYAKLQSLVDDLILMGIPGDNIKEMIKDKIENHNA